MLCEQGKKICFNPYVTKRGKHLNWNQSFTILVKFCFVFLFSVYYYLTGVYEHRVSQGAFKGDNEKSERKSRIINIQNTRRKFTVKKGSTFFCFSPLIPLSFSHRLSTKKVKVSAKYRWSQTQTSASLNIYSVSAVSKCGNSETLRDQSLFG